MDGINQEQLAISKFSDWWLTKGKKEYKTFTGLAKVCGADRVVLSKIVQGKPVSIFKMRVVSRQNLARITGIKEFWPDETPELPIDKLSPKAAEPRQLSPSTPPEESLKELEVQIGRGIVALVRVCQLVGQGQAEADEPGSLGRLMELAEDCVRLVGDTTPEGREALREAIDGQSLSRYLSILIAFIEGDDALARSQRFSQQGRSTNGSS